MSVQRLHLAANSISGVSTGRFNSWVRATPAINRWAIGGSPSETSYHHGEGHAIASIALELSQYGSPLEIHFGWSHESPLAVSASFLLFGQGNVPWMVRELLRKAQPDSALRPRVVLG